MMKTARMLLVLSMVSLLLMVTSSVHAQQAVCDAKDGLWDESSGKCTVKSGFEIDVNYPTAIWQYPFAEQTVDTFLNDYKTQFMQSYTPVDHAGAYANFWTLSFDYQVFNHSQSIMSLLFSISTYTGGAHPNYDFHTFTFDLQKNTEITLDNLFVKGSNPWATIAPIVQQSLETQLATEIGSPLVDTDKQAITDGTGEDPQNYQNFVLDGDSLVFHFPPYQVAAYAAGPQSVSIPLSSLSGLIDPSVIGS